MSKNKRGSKNLNNEQRGPDQVQAPAEQQLEEVKPEQGLSAEQLAVAQALAPVIDPKSDEAKKERHPDRLKKSEIVAPVKFCKDLFTAMITSNPQEERKSMLKKAIDSGVALYTARTQYQIWKKERKEALEKLASEQVQPAAAAS